MTNKDDRMDDRMMDDEAVGDAVLSYLNDNPELVRDVTPERDLWPGIESRISARVLPLAHQVDQTVLQRKLRWKSWLPMAAAAAVLIAGSASVTYVLTKRGDVVVQTSRAPQSVATGPALPSTSTQSSTPVQNVEGQQTVDQPEADSRDVAVASPRLRDRTGNLTTPGRTRSGSAAPSPTRLVSHNDDNADPRVTYDAEITTLRSALDARRSQLDPATVKTIEQNLRVIDNAIAQSRAALTKDPKSRFLGNQLDRSLAKKTDLLRAAALLPSA